MSARPRIVQVAPRRKVRRRGLRGGHPPAGVHAGSPPMWLTSRESDIFAAQGLTIIHGNPPDLRKPGPKGPLTARGIALRRYPVTRPVAARRFSSWVGLVVGFCLVGGVRCVACWLGSVGCCLFGAWCCSLVPLCCVARSFSSCCCSVGSSFSVVAAGLGCVVAGCLGRGCSSSCFGSVVFGWVVGLVGLSSLPGVGCLLPLVLRLRPRRLWRGFLCAKMSKKFILVEFYDSLTRKRAPFC